MRGSLEGREDNAESATTRNPFLQTYGGGIRRVVLAPFLPVLLGGSRPEDALADADDALADAEPLEEPAVGRALKNSDAMII